MFQINTDFLTNQLQSFLTKYTLYLSFISKNNICSPSQSFLEILFYHVLLVFTVDQVYNDSNKNRHRRNLHKTNFYTRQFISILHFEKKLALSIANVPSEKASSQMFDQILKTPLSVVHIFKIINFLQHNNNNFIYFGLNIYTTT